MHTLAIHLAVTITILGLDLWSKAAIFRFLEAEIIQRPGETPLLRSGAEHVLFPGFALEAAINLGAFNGMLANMRWLLLAISVIAAIGTLVVALFPKKMPWGITLALGMIAGGAIGNFYDRVQFGAVRDFVKWYVGDHVWPNFNVADSGIVVGVTIILIAEVQNARREKRALRAAAAAQTAAGAPEAAGSGGEESTPQSPERAGDSPTSPPSAPTP